MCISKPGRTAPEEIRLHVCRCSAEKDWRPVGGKHVWDIELAERDEYEDWDFMHALNVYRNQPIEMSVASDNPIIRMFAIVDRRVGKRTLARLRDTVHAQPEWLKRLYVARMVADGIGE